MFSKIGITAVSSLALCAGSAGAQIVINEVLQNPAGGGDEFNEYVEFYGTPGMSLDGYAIALLNGGEDDGDNIPEVPAEIDEAFSLDGLSIGANGFFVLYNDIGGFSDIPGLLPAGTTSAGFVATHIATSDTPGKLSNDGSTTYVLVRKRVMDAGLPFGTTLRKDVRHDVDYDGKTDYGIEITVPGGGGIAKMVDPMQHIDNIAWSNAGGKEYVRSSEHEISETPGFNPDMISRLAYYGANPMLGLRLDGGGMTVPTRTADESWLYGEMIGLMLYDYDPARTGAPTDPNGDGFQDLDVTGATLTPGDFNDTGSFVQFRFVTGDIDFDQDADCDDLALAETFLGRSFDETEDFIDPDTGMPIADPNNPGSNFQAYVFQGRLANAFLAARGLDAGDGSDMVTQSDLDALAALVGPCDDCPIDFTGDGVIDSGDLSAFITLYIAGDTGADLTMDGVVDAGDLSFFISGFIDPSSVCDL